MLFAVPESRIDPGRVVRIAGTKWVHSEPEYFHTRDVNFLKFSVKLVPGFLGSCVMTALCQRTLSSPKTSNRIVLLTLAGAIPTEPLAFLSYVLRLQSRYLIYLNAH